MQAALDTFTARGAQIIGVSMDDVEKQKKFSDKFKLQFPLLADTDGKICDAFKVAHPNSKPARETFLFKKGKLVALDKNVQPKRQAQDLLRWMDELE